MIDSPILLDFTVHQRVRSLEEEEDYIISFGEHERPPDPDRSNNIHLWEQRGTMVDAFQPGPEASTSLSILDQLSASLSSPTEATPQLSLLRELQSTLSAQCTRLIRDEITLEESLLGDPFPLLQALSPLLGQDSPLSELAEGCLRVVMRTSSAKEIVLGLDERLLQLRRVMTDEEDEIEDDEGEGEGKEELDLAHSAKELALLICFYSKTLTRIKTPKLARFLLSAVDTINTSISSFSYIAPGNSGISLASAVVDFIEELESSTWIEKESETCLTHLQNLLIVTAQSLHRSLPENLAESFFLSHYPRYRIPGRSCVPSAENTRVWSRIVARLIPLKLTAPILLNKSSSSLGSFILLAHLTASYPSSPPCLNLPPEELLRQTQPILMLGLSGNSGSQGLSEDEALFWIWWCLETLLADEKGEDMDEGLLFTFTEMMSSLSALSPNPSTRFLSFRFVTTLITKATRKEEIQIMILKDLIENCPFDSLKVASIGLLREVLGGKFEAHQITEVPSLFLSPLFEKEFGSLISRFSPHDLLASKPEGGAPITVEAFLENHGQLTIQKLGLYFVILNRDGKNLTGIKSAEAIEATKTFFLEPLERNLREWKLHLDGELEMELMLLESSLERVLEVISL